MFQALNNFHGPLLDSLQCVHVSLVGKSSELDTHRINSIHFNEQNHNM